MIDRELNHQLDLVAERLRRYQFWTGMGIVWISVAILVGLIYAISRSTGAIVEGGLPLVLILALVGSVVAILISVRSGRNLHHLAQQIESRNPQLDSALLTAIEQHPDLETGNLGYLQQTVVDRAIHHAHSHNWQNLISRKQMGLSRVSAFGGVLLLLLGVFGLNSLSFQPTAKKADAALSFNDVVQSGTEYQVTVEPGHTEVERGTSLLVLARFADRLPPDAKLIYTTEDGTEHSVAMSQSLDDPLFGGRIAAVSQPLSYRVELGNQQTPFYRVSVFEYPLLLQTDARLIFPSYTNRVEKFVQDVRRVTAVEGTKLTLLCRVNKPLMDARFVEETEAGEATIALSADESDPLTYAVTLTVDRSRELTLHLTDEDRRANQHPPRFQINVISNRPPDIKLAQPTRDIEVSPIEEIDLAASVWDDFGLQRVGISYSIPGKLDREVSLGEKFPARERIQTEHLLALEDLDADPDQLLSWYFWAEDIAPDGEVRRTSSDMFFAEVRPFEEIFRQGQQPPGGEQQQQQQQGGQNAQQAQELAKLQKQIINATWKVIRRETRSEPTSQFAEDVRLIVESQQTALAQAEELEQKLQDPESLEHVERVKQEMQAAIVLLESAVNGPTIAELQPALGHEQAAYQNLLRLRAREHEVVQSNQSQQSSQSQQSQNSRSQQQLEQLQLREDENRYAQEQQAQTEQEQQAGEDRQVLNRLRELSQRQNDLNERMKELQAALEAAETEEERAEAERQLKRLREEQEEILRDTEELSQRMEQPENQERMAEQREQLEEARENVRRSSEALEEGMVTQAANEGTRAERELEELKEEFQKRTSGQFEQEMREMREQAQELTQNEEKLAEQLEKLLSGKDDESNSLRDSSTREEAEQQLAQQKKRLDQLLENMRNTIEQAEETQPLLAKQLYETIRSTRKADPQKALDATDLSLRRGFLDDAVEQEEEVRTSIGQLTEGVAQAAEKILGDETEKLRRALNDLERLNEDLEGEIARAEGREPSLRGGQTSEEENEEGTPRQSADSPRQPGQESETPSESPSRSEQEPGEQPAGESQPGSGDQPRPDQPPEPGDQPRQQPGQQPGQQGSPSNRQPNESPSLTEFGGGLEQLLNGGGSQPSAPFSGDDFIDWSDRLRDVEEIVDDPELRAEAARIRDAARELRKEILGTSAPPQWDIIKQKVAQPLSQLQNRVAEQLLKRTADDARVPIDKEPVPTKYESAVRRYYERLGSGK